MAAAPSGAVVIPAVMRQLIGVRSAPASIVLLGQEIRAVGTVGYDERGFTQVTVKTSGWVREVFVEFDRSPRTQRRPLLHPLLTGPPGHAGRVSPRRENAGSTGCQSAR